MTPDLAAIAAHFLPGRPAGRGQPLRRGPYPPHLCHPLRRGRGARPALSAAGDQHRPLSRAGTAHGEHRADHPPSEGEDQTGRRRPGARGADPHPHARGRFLPSRCGRRLLARLSLHRARPGPRDGHQPGARLSRGPGHRPFPAPAGRFPRRRAPSGLARLSPHPPAAGSSSGRRWPPTAPAARPAYRQEIRFIEQRAAGAGVLVDLLAQGRLPLRVTHNDAKFSNVLLDDATGEGLCVIDLDTVMPGTALVDFADAVRSGAALAAEDEPDASRAGLSLQIFDALAHGYLDAGRDFLTPAEIEHLPAATRVITLEQAIRFLGDHLNGDSYYRVQRAGQNLDRARTQLPHGRGDGRQVWADGSAGGALSLALLR
ncbi:MAG: phosphotransferase [Anaerolineae bacterium]